jgi:hypothetical protein
MPYFQPQGGFLYIRYPVTVQYRRPTKGVFGGKGAVRMDTSTATAELAALMDDIELLAGE